MEKLILPAYRNNDHSSTDASGPGTSISHTMSTVTFMEPKRKPAFGLYGTGLVITSNTRLQCSDHKHEPLAKRKAVFDYQVVKLGIHHSHQRATTK